MKDKVAVRSEVITEIIENRPDWKIRWGNAIVLIMLSIGFFLASVPKFEYVVKTKVTDIKFSESNDTVLTGTIDSGAPLVLNKGQKILLIYNTGREDRTVTATIVKLVIDDQNRTIVNIKFDKHVYQSLPKNMIKSEFAAIYRSTLLGRLLMTKA